MCHSSISRSRYHVKSLPDAESVMLVITRLPPTGRLRGTILTSRSANIGGMDPEALDPHYVRRHDLSQYSILQQNCHIQI